MNSHKNFNCIWTVIQKDLNNGNTIGVLFCDGTKIETIHLLLRLFVFFWQHRWNSTRKNVNYWKEIFSVKEPGSDRIPFNGVVKSPNWCCFFHFLILSAYPWFGTTDTDRYRENVSFLISWFMYGFFIVSPSYIPEECQIPNMEISVGSLFEVKQLSRGFKLM